MFQSVLVPVGFTERDLEAVDLATRFVSPDGEVTLVHVIQTVPGIDLDGDPDFYGRLESAASAKMSAMGERLEGTGVAWSAVLVVGHRYEEIVRLAEDGYDLLVVSSHRVDLDDPRAGAATMSYRLAVGSPCAVLLLK